MDQAMVQVLLRQGATEDTFLSASERNVAEGEGFEPPEPCGSAVFKTAAIDHSATLPIAALPFLALALVIPRPCPVRKLTGGARKNGAPGRPPVATQARPPAGALLLDL